MRKLLVAGVALFVALGCSSDSVGVAGQVSSEPQPLPAGQKIVSDLVGTWTVSGKDYDVTVPGKPGEVKQFTYDGDGTSIYKADGTFSSHLSKDGYELDTLGTYRIDGTRATLTYTKINLIPPKSAESAEVFKLKPMVQQALNQPADGALAFKGKNSATLTFGNSIETLTRR